MIVTSLDLWKIMMELHPDLIQGVMVELHPDLIRSVILELDHDLISLNNRHQREWDVFVWQS